MTKEAFIRKWLGNPEKPYTQTNRDEMRDDLDLVIEAALRQPPAIKSVCPECQGEPTTINTVHYFFCEKCKKMGQTVL